MSPLAIQLAIAGLAAFSAGAVIYVLLLPRFDGSKRSNKRLEAAVRPRASVKESKGKSDTRKRRRSVEDVQRDFEEKQKALAKQQAKPPLSLQLRRAGLNWTRKTYWMVGAGIGAVVFVVLFITGTASTVPSAGLGIAAAVFGPKLVIKFRASRRQKKFLEEFPNAVDVIVRGVKAGLPLVDCMRIISKDSQEPVKSEFLAIIEEQAIGVPLGEAISKLPQRMPLAEANFFAIVITIQAQAGGSLSEALAGLSKVLRGRKQMKAKITAMSQEAKSSAGIIGSLPFFVSGIIYLVAPQYIIVLWTTSAGNMILVGCAVSMALGSLVMRNMINFDI